MLWMGSTMGENGKEVSSTQKDTFDPELSKMRMSVTSGLQSKPVKKYVLQQSNCNVDISQDKEEDQKPIEKNIFPSKIKEEMALETENQCSPIKPDRGPKSDAKKLRSIRLDLSSLKRGAIKETNLKPNDSSEESSEDEVKKKQKTRPVVPNYVTNTESGPCRKPRQSRQDQLSFSSQNSPKVSSQILSIERRNARERNRVKLVNEGFASLQDRIPDFISEAYNEEKGKKSAKKLSKVDTLRMAVDYIRHLETLLDLRSTEKTEDQSWDPATPGGYQSPKYQPSCVDSPGTSFEQTYDQDRIFYAYDLNFESQKETLPSGEEPVTLVILKSPNSYVEDDFQYYETFNSIKKENGEDVKEKISEGEEENVENLDVTERDPELLPKDVIKMAAKESMAMPLNNEPFAMNEGITIFF